MTADRPVSGSIIRYPYLWHWQALNGETEGRKHRPVCLLLVIPKGNRTHLVILAISATPPRPDQAAVPVPVPERRRAGLDATRDAWVTVSEFNHDIAEISFHYRTSDPPVGAFSDRFLAQIALAFKPFLVRPGTGIDRTR